MRLARGAEALRALVDYLLCPALSTVTVRWGIEEAWEMSPGQKEQPCSGKAQAGPCVTVLSQG